MIFRVARIVHRCACESARDVSVLLPHFVQRNRKVSINTGRCVLINPGRCVL
jgi:hypothetical protein